MSPKSHNELQQQGSNMSYSPIPSVVNAELISKAIKFKLSPVAVFSTRQSLLLYIYPGRTPKPLSCFELQRPLGLNFHKPTLCFEPEVPSESYLQIG